jgi:cytochrome c oxidase assembly protein subunit 15
MSRLALDRPAPDPSRDGVVGAGPASGLRVLAVGATAATFVLIAVGALVRATDSGLGCTGWPKCTPDRWLPPLEYHAIIEYTHRMTAFIDVVLIVWLAALAWRRYRGVDRVFRPVMAAAIFVIFQAVLGGIVVKGDLHALLVTAHFMTAMILAGTLVVATVGAYTLDIERPALRPVDGLSRLAWAAAAAMFALLGVGAYVRGEGAGLAFKDWPLMNGRLVPDLSNLRPALHFTHRALAAAVFVLVVGLGARAWRARAERPAVAVLASCAAGLFAAQILIGAANVWSRLATPAVTAHVAVAGLLWGTVVGAASTARIPAGSARTRDVPPSVPEGSLAPAGRSPA